MGTWMHFVVLLSSCLSLSTAHLSCQRECNIRTNLGCSVTDGGQFCPTTALQRGKEWPSKPRNLTTRQYVISEANSAQNVGINISWQMPNDASAKGVDGFELSLVLLGSEVMNVQNCYVVSVVHNGNRSSSLYLQELRDSVFTLQCKISPKAESLYVQLFSLPKPKENTREKMLAKNVKVLDILPAPAADPCKTDPLIDVVFSPQRQIIVKVGSVSGESRYNVSLMRGSFQYSWKTIQPGKISGKPEKATFEDPRLIIPGVCYSIRVLKEGCIIPWTRYAVEPFFCIPEEPTTTPFNRSLNPVVTPDSSMAFISVPGDQGLSPVYIAILSASVVGVLVLGFIIVFFIYRRHSSPYTPLCPYSFVKAQDGDSNITGKGGLPPVPDGLNNMINQGQGRVDHIILFYCISKATSKCVEQFKVFLEKVCPEHVTIIDFADPEMVDCNPYEWKDKLKTVADLESCRVLTIYSEGLAHLMEAEINKTLCKKYENSVHNGEFVVVFYKAIKESLFFARPRQQSIKEIVISLGPKFTELDRFSLFLSWKSGVRLHLIAEEKGRKIIDNKNMLNLLTTLGIDNAVGCLQRADLQIKPLLEAVENMLKEQAEADWFDKVPLPDSPPQSSYSGTEEDELGSRDLIKEQAEPSCFDIDPFPDSPPKSSYSGTEKDKLRSPVLIKEQADARCFDIVPFPDIGTEEDELGSSDSSRSSSPALNEIGCVNGLVLRQKCPSWVDVVPPDTSV